MGKLLTGRYGSPPDAESIPITLTQCNQKLNLKPSDFVSSGPPKFFEKRFGSSARYLLFLLEADEVKDNGIWKPGYYLLPLEAKDVLSAIENRRAGAADATVLPIEWEEEPKDAPEAMREKALAWGKASQPLFFKCTCKKLTLRLYPPWAMRQKWKSRLRCPRRCQPAITTLL
jgi:hypothetical protein